MKAPLVGTRWVNIHTKKIVSIVSVDYLSSPGKIVFVTDLSGRWNSDLFFKNHRQAPPPAPEKIEVAP